MTAAETAVRNPRGKWHLPADIFDLVLCGGRFDGYRTVQETPAEDVPVKDRCGGCWSEEPPTIEETHP